MTTSHKCFLKTSHPVFCYLGTFTLSNENPGEHFRPPASILLMILVRLLCSAHGACLWCCSVLGGSSCVLLYVDFEVFVGLLGPDFSLNAAFHYSSSWLAVTEPACVRGGRAPGSRPGSCSASATSGPPAGRAYGLLGTHGESWVFCWPPVLRSTSASRAYVARAAIF